ncbi:Structural maintenance of chromosomes flexible hinge domain-containing protein 1 [Merluccius polli]|uniref:Structural maintenance of chromosomes flexible hinge domain-containing protein 1 n=1 Tax=Merluccius polli TaxID=89951 RepID=A0AA47M144_MERPO|nr:Structural maintenance of chromosomes flexible hinge domain-containing protein 1 [Merluccius polli]
MRALSRRKDELSAALVTYKNVFKAHAELLNLLTCKHQDASRKQAVIKTELSSRMVNVAPLETVLHVEAAIREQTAACSRLSSEPRRTCAIADPFRGTHDVLGKFTIRCYLAAKHEAPPPHLQVCHLALVEDDDVAAVLSWHIQGEMDCVVTVTTVAARRIYDHTQGRQQVLPLDSMYADPNHRYADPNHRYADPNHRYADPNHRYADPNHRYADPHHRYADPNHRYADPNHRYADPNHRYADPNNRYADPNHRYADPNHRYADPNHRYADPHHRYADPHHRYADPNHRYADPNHRYADPNHRYADPNNRYADPNHRYADPNHRYADPNHRYADPNHRYADPNHRYADPNHRYADPNHRYADPNHRYADPNHRYADPNHRYATSTTGTRPPPQTALECPHVFLWYFLGELRPCGPLPHLGSRTPEPPGNPIFARDLLIYPEHPESCKIVFKNLLGNTILIDDLDAGNAYRKIVVQSHRPCPTILTRQGDRISAMGKFGGTRNRAPGLGRLQGQVFGAPLPAQYYALMGQIEAAVETLSAVRQNSLIHHLNLLTRSETRPRA